jgi:hypothetical protein
VLSVTPHIVRAPAIIDAANRDVFSGTESSVRERPLRLEAAGDFRGTGAAPTPSQAPSAPPAQTSAPTPVPGPRMPAANATPASTPPLPVAPPPAAEAPAGAAAPASEGAPATPPAPGAVSGDGSDLRLQGPPSARVGESFSVSLMAAGLQGLKQLPVTLRYDPAVLRFEGAKVGALAETAGGSIAQPTVNARAGRVEVPMSFGAGEGLAGEGALLELSFTVQTGRSSTQLILAQSEPTGLDGSARAALLKSHSLQLKITP